MDGGEAEMSVWVIGAGVTGLTFAQMYKDAQVFEAASAVGGKAISQVVAAEAGRFVFDVGGHWFHQQSAPEVLKLLDGLPLKKHKRKAYVLLDNRLYDFPIQASFRSIPDFELVKRISHELRGGQDKPVLARNVEELLQHTYGTTLYDLFFRDYNRKMYGVEELEDIPLGKYHAVRNVPLHNRSGYNNEFYYPAGDSGAGGIPQHLARGLTVHYQSPVQDIHLSSQTLSLHNRTIRWDKLVSTIPLPLLLERIIDAPPAVIKLSRQLKASKGFILNIGFHKRSNPKPIDWVYIPDMNVPFYRVGYYSHVQPLLAPVGYESMYVECSPLFFDNKEEAMKLIPGVIAQLVKLGFIEQAEDVVTMQPIWLEQNYCLPNPQVVSALHTFLRDNGIYSIGRYGSWHWSSQHEDMKQAIDLARELKEGMPVQSNMV